MVTWRVVAGIAVLWIVLGTLIGFTLVTRGPDPEEKSGPWSRRKKAGVFLIGFLGWPFLLLLVVFFYVLFWGYPDVKDDDDDDIDPKTGSKRRPHQRN